MNEKRDKMNGERDCTNERNKQKKGNWRQLGNSKGQFESSHSGKLDKTAWESWNDITKRMLLQIA